MRHRFHTSIANSWKYNIKVGAKLKKQRRLSSTRKSLDDAVKDGLDYFEWKKKKTKEDLKRARQKKKAQKNKLAKGKKKKAK